MSERARPDTGYVSVSARPRDTRLFLLLSGLITVILWRLPYGREALYPFTLLATFVHEMGHGLTALAIGGQFHSLQFFSNGSGIAHYSVQWPAASALVAAGGLVGPSVAGAVLLAIGREPKFGRGVLFLFGSLVTVGVAIFVVYGADPQATDWDVYLAATIIFGAALRIAVVAIMSPSPERGGWARSVLSTVGWLMVASIVLFVRGSFGISVVGLAAAALILIGTFGSERLSSLALQFISVQLGLAVFTDLNYMFSAYAQIEGQSEKLPSDSQAIANVLPLPYWFWGGLAAAFSFLVLAIGLYVALRPTSPPAKQARPSRARPRRTTRSQRKGRVAKS